MAKLPVPESLISKLREANAKWRRLADGRVEVRLPDYLDFVPLEYALKEGHIDIQSILQPIPKSGCLKVYYQFTKMQDMRKKKAPRMGLSQTRKFLVSVAESIQATDGDKEVCLETLSHQDLVLYMCKVDALRVYTQRPFFSLFPANTPRILRAKVVAGDWDEILHILVAEIPEYTGIVRDAIRRRCRKLGEKPVIQAIVKHYQGILGSKIRWENGALYDEKTRRLYERLDEAIDEGCFDQLLPRVKFLAMIPDGALSCAASRCEKLGILPVDAVYNLVMAHFNRTGDKRQRKRPRQIDQSVKPGECNRPKRQESKRRRGQGLLDLVKAYLGVKDAAKVNLLHNLFDEKQTRFNKASTIAPVHERFRILSAPECEDFALACGWLKRDNLRRLKRRLGRKQRHLYLSVVRFAWILKVAKMNHLNVTLFSGAGISTGKGANLPTVRGSTKASPSAAFDAEILEQISPTASHMVIKALMDEGYIQFVCTQNIEGLHKASGLNPGKVWEVHGNIFDFKCTKCGTVFDDDNPPPCPVMVCPKCNPESSSVYLGKHGRECFTRHSGLLRRRVIRHYGEAVHPPPSALKRLNRTEVSIVVGTSLQVGNIATFACPDDIKKRPLCVVINKGQTK